MKILLVSHGPFAEGMCRTLREFFGAQNVYAASVSQEDGTESLKKAVEGYWKEWGDEQVVICSDVKSGSANQTMMLYYERPNTFLISGMNLSLVLQLMMEDEVTADDLHEMIASAKEDMMLINDISFAQDEDDE